LYGLAANKGYSTPKHIAALREHGPSPLHRQSFAPVWMSNGRQELLDFVEAETVMEAVELDADA
jgi:ribonuclease HII